MATVGDIARSAFDLLTPESQTDRLTFKRYDGATITKNLSEGNSDVPPEEIITLKVNPYSIDRKKAKITQKVQTNAPGRFIVFDWGTDLESMTINGNTGNLLPDIAQNGTALISSMGIDGANEAVGRVLYGKLSYFELLAMSPKYQTFKKLENLFKIFDADRDILILELGEEILRIFFTDFSFSVTAENPWNWKYSISVINLANLTDKERREDVKVPTNGVDLNE